MDNARPGAGWSSWDGLPEGHGGRVVSSSLRAVGEPVENPLLPKTRSWFALGAPLELLSPLSCWRILFAAAALWCVVVALIGGWQHPNVGVDLTAGALVAVWIALLRVRRVDALASEGLGAALAAGGAVVVWSARGGVATAGLAPCLLVGAAVAGMFLPAGAIARLRVRDGLLLDEPLAGAPTRVQAAHLELGPAHAHGGSATMWLAEGRHHQVKRMIRTLGAEVVTLHRGAISGCALPADLGPGTMRPATEAELNALLAPAAPLQQCPGVIGRTLHS